MQETTIIDHAVLSSLLENLGGDHAFLAELMQTYFDDSRQQIAVMQAAVTAGDAETLRRAAHSLKSSSANFGAMALSSLCRELEMMGKAGVFDGATDKITAVATEYGGVRDALEAVRTRTG